MGSFLVVGMFAPHSVIAEVPAMIAPEDDNGIGRQAEMIQFVQHTANLGIHITDSGVIAMDQCARLLIVERAGWWNVAVLPQFTPSGWGIGRRAFRRSAQSRQLEGIALIKIPVFLRRAKWQVRFQKADGDEERLTRPVFGRLQTADGLVSDFAVRVGVIRDIGGLVG